MKTRTALVLAGLGAAALSGCSSDSGREEPRADAAMTRDVPAVIRFDCGRAAQKMSTGTVYCPPLVPKGRTQSQNRSSRGLVSITASGDTYTLHFVTEALAGFDPAQPHGYRRHLGHWYFAAFDSRRYLTTGPGARVVDQLGMEGVPVTIAERRSIAPSLDAGHVFALWPFRGRTFELSLHGFEHRDTLLTMLRALIAEMHSCTPPSHGSNCALVFRA